MSTNVLESRDTNMQNPISQSAEKVVDSKPKSMDYHRQALENKLKNDGASSQEYVSPSDAIMSPASKKLSSFKQKQMNKHMGTNTKPRSLFATAMTSRERDLGAVESEKGL